MIYRFIRECADRNSMIITFYKFDGVVNRYYTIHDRQGDLFSTYSFTALWGIEMHKGREKVYVFESREPMERKIRAIFRDRMRKGYSVLYSFARKRAEKELLQKIEGLRSIV